MNPELPAELDRIIDKALEKDRELALSARVGYSRRFEAPEARHGFEPCAAAVAAAGLMWAGLVPALGPADVAAGLPRHFESAAVKPPLQATAPIRRSSLAW